MKVYGLVRAGSGWGQKAGTCGCGNEMLGSLKCGEFLDLLKKFFFTVTPDTCDNTLLVSSDL